MTLRHGVVRTVGQSVYQYGPIRGTLDQGSQFRYRVVRTSPRGYRYVDYPLPDGTNVLIGTEVYQPVPPRISAVTEAYRSVRLDVVGECILRF